MAADWQSQHALSVNGKSSRITDDDLLAVGERYGIGTASKVLARVKETRDSAHTVESLTLYDAWRKSGCMKGAFFGHDHTNTFDGMDKNGIRIGMTKSINCGGSYGDGEPGLRVFRVRKDGSFESWTETEITLR